ILTLFTGTLLACSLLLSWWKHAPLLSAATLLPSTICGLVVWLFVMAFHLKKESALLPVDDVPAFRQRVRSVLVELGYVPVRVSGEQLSAVQEEVLRVLAQDGAEVVCDVSILAQSELGIPTSTVEGRVRDWLRGQEAKAVIQKEYLQPPEKVVGEKKSWHSIT